MAVFGGYCSQIVPNFHVSSRWQWIGEYSIRAQTTLRSALADVFAQFLARAASSPLPINRAVRIAAIFSGI